MLSKEKRLNLKIDFKWVASGRKLETKYLKLFVKSGDNRTPRVGIALGSKSFKKATQRNRAKRVASAAFGMLYKKLPPNANIIALPKTGVLEVKSSDVLLDLEKTLKHEKFID
ncbi:ribonuclease P protein component [Candidatus Microgenomates bacterium]|nr:ribonuclease P protein component [Candidatus Microgenomates bacterium]